MASHGKFVLLTFFLILFLGAMVLGPILYYGVGLVFPIPFHRAMDRALLISAVAALIFFCPRIPLGKLWPLSGNSCLQFLLGYFIAAVSTQAILGLDAAFGAITRAHLSSHQVETRVLIALGAAILVPPLEETIFRGFIQTELIERFGWRAGWIAAAAIFMLAHFLKISPDLDHQPVHPWSGVTAVGSAFLPVIHGEFLSGRGLNLFLIGLILGGIFLRSGTLWVNAGLHSGWILAILLASGFTHPSDHPYFSFLGGDILSNPVTSLVLIMLGFWIWRFYRHPSVVPETGGNAP